MGVLAGKAAIVTGSCDQPATRVPAVRVGR